MCKIEWCLALFFFFFFSPCLADRGAMLSYLSNINESSFFECYFFKKIICLLLKTLIKEKYFLVK